MLSDCHASEQKIASGPPPSQPRSKTLKFSLAFPIVPCTLESDLEERRPWSSTSGCRFGPAQRNKGTAIDVVNVSLDGKIVGHDYSHFPPYAVNDSCPARLKILHAPSLRPTTRVSHPQTPLTTLSSGTENRPFCDSSGGRRHTTVSAVRRRRSKARCAR